MLEIKPFDAWAEANATTDPSEKIKQYADYVRTNAYKNGQLDESSEREIQQGIYDRAIVDGLITEGEPEADINLKMQGLITPTRNKDADAKFLLDHYQIDFAAGSPEASEKAPTIQKYLSLKQVSPDKVGDLQGVIDGYLDDKNAVKSARLSAVDRGDYRVISVEEEGGRQLYTGADTKPENLNGELDSLISNGAISPSDLRSVRELMSPINGGKSTVAEGTRYSVFDNTLRELAKKDPTLRSSLDQESARIREAKRESQMTTGESIFENVKEIVAVPFDALSNVVSDVFGLSHPEEQAPAPSELVANNKAITSKFSNTEVEKFLGDFIKRQSGPVYRADRPETGIDVDSLGNPIVSPALVANKAQFEKALSMAPLNDDQKERATIGRMATLETEAPKILKLILGESDEAASSFAQAKAAGKTDAQFVEDWVGNNSQNYNGMSERLQQLGMSTFSAIATLPTGIGALMGIEPAAKALVAMNKEQSDREQYAQLFGDEFGLGFQLINTIPQVATDILATIGTTGAYTVAKGVARGGAKAVTREALRGAVSMVDDATAVLVKDAAKAGGEAFVSGALKGVGDSLATKLARADQLVPLFATTFTRSASSTYGSIYGQLPDTMSHDEKHQNAFGYGIAAGLSTAVITSGMSFLGNGGVEDLATGKFRPATLADETATNVRKVPLSELNYKQAKFLYENLENAGAKLSDGAFQKALRSNIGGEYKNYLRTVLKGGGGEGFEEALDTAIQGRIEDAALDRNTPLSERVNQIFTAFTLGGILGGAVSSVTQLAAPLQQSEISLALDARASVLTKVANDLRKTGSNATAEVLQRQLNDAQAAANEQKQLEIAAQQQKEERVKFEEVVTNVDKPISFEPVAEVAPAIAQAAPTSFDPTGQAELPVGDTRSMVLPETTRFLTDFEGERAYVGSYGGTLERVGDAVHLNLDEPRADGVTHLVVGNKFQPIDKSGVRLDRKRLMVTGEHRGSIPAGTPYVAPNPKNKQQFALPPEAENVSLAQDMADAPVLRIKNARLIGQENILSDIILTDKGQIEDALRYYNLEFAKVSKPENIQQLELGLFDEPAVAEPATTPVANPAAVITSPALPASFDSTAVQIPFESTYARTQNGPLETTSGESSTINYAGRIITVLSINGVKVPFYISTGSGGKKGVPAGKWYPFFGIGADGWLNKTKEADINSYYGSPELRQAAEYLNSSVGDIRKNKDIPKTATSGPAIPFINSDLNPVENDTPTTIDDLAKEIDRIKTAIAKTKGKPMDVAATPAEVVLADAEQTGITPPAKSQTEESTFVNSLIKESPLALALLDISRQGYSAAAINNVAESFTPEDFADLQARIDTANNFASGLDDALSGTRQEIFGSLNSMQAIYDRVRVAQFTPAKAPAAPEADTKAAPVVDDYEVLHQMLSNDVTAAGPLVDRFGDLLAATAYDPKTRMLDYTADGEEYATAITVLDLAGNRDAIEAYRSANKLESTPAAPTAATTPYFGLFKNIKAVVTYEEQTKPKEIIKGRSEPTVIPAAKKPARGKKVPVTPLPAAIVVDNEENPTEAAAILQEELSELASTVPVFDADGRTTTLESLEVELLQLDGRVSSAKETGRAVPSSVLDSLKRLRDSVKQARILVGSKSSEIEKQIKELSSPDPDVDIRTDQQRYADDLLDIMEGRVSPSPDVAAKAAAVEAVKSKFKEKAGVGPVAYVSKQPPIAVYKSGLFRNTTEAELFTEWAAGGYMISNLAEHGYDPRAVSGIPFQSHSVEIKQRLFKAVTENFPLIPVPEGTATLKSKVQVPNMDKAGSSWMDVPVVLDTNKTPIAGVFTNNPLVTLQQIDRGLMVLIPKSIVSSKGFSLNKSIDTRPTGNGGLEVIGVRRHPNDTGVYNAGDVSLVGNSSYKPKKAMTSLGNLLREPAPQFLNGAGPSARNKANNTFETYMNDMMSVSQSQNVATPAGVETQQSSFGNFEGLITNVFGLSEDKGREAMSEAQVAYANNLKEYGLAKRIESSLIKAQQLNPSTTLFDIDIPKIILEETTSKGQVTPPIEDVSDALRKIYGKTAQSPKGELTNYGVYLYNSVTSGAMSVGVKPFRTHVRDSAKRYQISEIRRNSKVRGNSAVSQEDYDGVMDSLVDPKSDIVESAIRLLDTSTLNQLAETLRTNTKAYDSLFKIVSRYIPNLDEDMDEVDLIDLAGRALNNYQKEEGVKIARDLKSSAEGLNLANALIDMGWLPPVEDEILTPKGTRAIPTQLEPLPKRATQADKKTRLSNAKKLARASVGVYLSEGDGNMLAAAARKVNNAEIKRLGIVSNDPESVIAALRNIQESGTPMQRLVAGVLTANADLIRNVRFTIGDMNDVRFAGVFMPKSNLVVINISGHNGRGVVDVLLHEYLHAVTIQTMTNPTTPAQIGAMQRIASLRNLTAAQAAKMGLNTEGFNAALTDDLEFITHALTAPEFQSLVRAATPTAQRSLLSRIWESLRALFGFDAVDKKMASAFDELLDFTQMFAGANTFNIQSERDLRLNAHKIEEGLSALREFAKVKGQLRSTSNVLLSTAPTEAEPNNEQILMEQLPKGFSLRMDADLKGIAGIFRNEPTVMRFNEAYLQAAVDGLSESAAKARIKGLVNHEVAHFAARSSFTPAQIERVASELGEDQLQKIAEEYYSTSGLTAEEILASVVTDRESGVLSDSRIADEWIRMQIEKAANGRTYEDIIKATKGNSTLLETVVDAIKVFATRLRQRFAEYPSTETAASISHAARALRKINKSKSIDFNADLYAEGRFGDTANFFSSLDGSPVEDQVSYAIPVMSSNEGKVDAMNERLRMYNLPSQLRDIVNLRNGTVNQITAGSKSLVKYFPKLRDNALKGGVDMEDIKILFGTTAPPLTDADLREILDLSIAYEATIPDTETEGRKADLVAEHSEKLKRERRLRFNEAFTKRQAAAEQSIRDAGFKELVDRAVLFRKDINKFKGSIGFDESNDVYLTRAYKFFNTEGWAAAAKMGGIIKIEGKDVDFNKLRMNAASAYYEESEAEFQKLGKPYTSQDVDDLTLRKLDNYLSSLETMTSAVDRQTIDSIRKDLNRFKPKKDIDSTFRELLGEIEDPLANAVNTAFRVGMLSANDKFKKDFAKTALDLGLASKDAKAGWVTSFAASSSKTTGDLAGLYFDPKVAGVINEMFGVNMKGLTSNSTGIMNGVGRAIMGVSGAAIQMKTQLGFGYWPRNVIGGYILSAAQGILMNPFSAKGSQSMKESWSGSFSALGTDEEQRNSILRLIQLNVLNDQSQGRAAQDLLRGLIATPEQDLQALMAAVDEARITNDAGGVVARLKAEGYITGGLAKAYSGYAKVTDFLAALDGAIDGTFKANAYYYELGIIQKHFGDAMSVEAQEEAAARKVKLTFAGHSQVIDIVKSFNKTPMAAVFLPFARWKSEVFRTMLNTVPLALEEIKQGGVMARRGAQRLAGFTATIAAAPVIVGTLMTTFFRALTGGEEEERELTAVELAALRESLPKWQRGHQIRAQVLKGGKIQMIDMSYVLPHSQLTDAVGIITEGFKTGDGINGSRLASYIVNDLIGTQIAATSVDEILNNENDRGQPIYLETDNSATVMMRVLGHFGKGVVVPSGAAKIIDITRTGQTNASELIWGEILGSRPKTNTFGEIERRGFRNLKGLLDDSVSTIGELTSGRFKSDKEIDEVVDRHQDGLNETQRRMNRFMRSMVSMGSEESSVYASAKIYKFSDDTIGSAYQGYRIAWRPNDKWNQKTYFNAQQAKEQDPMQKIQSINRSVNRKGSVYYVNGPYDE